MIQWISAIIDYLYGDIIRGWVLEYVFPSGPVGKPDHRKIQGRAGGRPPPLRRRK